VNVQVAQQIINSFLLDGGRVIVLPVPVFQLRRLNTLGITGLTIKRERWVLSILENQT